MLQVPAEAPLTALPIMDKGKPAIIAFLSLPRRLASSVLAHRAEALFLVLDEKGDAESIVPLRIENPNLEKNSYRLIFTAPAHTGRAVCRVALCNMGTGYGVRGLQTVTVPEAREAAFWLDPPLLLTDRGAEDVFVSPGAALEQLYGYDPQEYSLFSGDLPAGTKTLWAALRITSIRPQAEIEIRAELSASGSANSESVPVTILRESVDEPTKKLLIKLAFGEISPGRYMLSLSARERHGQAVARTTVILTVKQSAWRLSRESPRFQRHLVHQGRIA
jgi:hypothetical protein